MFKNKLGLAGTAPNGHANMHPLIPVAKNTFWNSTQIYRYCIYQFCRNYNLSRLWGYLWINWYNKKDWKLFARSVYPPAMPIARTTMITESHWRQKLQISFYLDVLGEITRIRLFNLQEILLLAKNPMLDLTEQNFNIEDSSLKDDMEIKGGKLRLKEILSIDTYYKNFRSIKKLNINFVDQILTLDGRSMLTFKELFYKKFIKQKLGFRNKDKNNWLLLGSEIIEMPQINKKIKKDIFDRITKKFVTNLKGEELMSILTNPNANNSFYNKNDPEDFNIVLKKCGENQKNSSITLSVNESSIITDVAQRHFELKIMYDKFFKENANQYEADDKRDEEKLLNFPISNEIISEFIKIENAYIYIDGSVINSGTENIAGLADNWITTAKAETLAFLLALLIILPKLYKVKAHADDKYHNILDRKIKEKYEDVNRTYSIDFNYNIIPEVKYLITWNNIKIEKRLRSFIRHYTEKMRALFQPRFGHPEEEGKNTKANRGNTDGTTISQNKKVKEIIRKAALFLIDRVNAYEKYNIDETSFLTFFDGESFGRVANDRSRDQNSA
ncbi:hypothetical protein RhiirA1_453220 [Rhizophagus irregularis]|uniref:RNase H type-1 domain-containing protein n=1 Tax=Rhizophagus irregularis TaxID=588596 RepID=A0A2N0S7Z5_9GLOM|nr:hypothetical protein RhiirA1_453220 [Rhizophagus irregularis]